VQEVQWGNGAKDAAGSRGWCSRYRAQGAGCSRCRAQQVQGTRGRVQQVQSEVGAGTRDWVQQVQGAAGRTGCSGGARQRVQGAFVQPDPTPRQAPMFVKKALP